MFFFVLRVTNLLPQPQVTVVSSYLGWMSFFMVSSNQRTHFMLPHHYRSDHQNYKSYQPSFGVRWLDTAFFLFFLFVFFLLLSERVRRKKERTKAVSSHRTPKRMEFLFLLVFQVPSCLY